MKIPDKDLYHFFCTKEGCFGFTEEETFEDQNRDAKKPDNFFVPEPFLYYRSSEKLLEEFSQEKSKERGE